tara:strand:+ start:293 stop:715 length:423 start_codon:yes stop_codon:yes gene_type:complete
MWNYRIIKKKDEYGLYEVFYNDSGDICAHAEKPEVIGETIDELRRSLQLMTLDLEKSKNDILQWGKIKFANWEDDPGEAEEYKFDGECPPGMIKVPKLDEGDCECVLEIPDGGGYKTPIPQEVDFDGIHIMMSGPPIDKK